MEIFFLMMYQEVAKSMWKSGGVSPLYEPAKDGKSPIGPFGFHVHEIGICEINDPENPFESAGGHYNPTDQPPHGNHAGDFPVIFSNNGYARMSFFY